MKKLLCGLMVLLVGVGLSQTKRLLAADRFDVVDKHMQAGLENQLYPGAQLLIMQHNKLVFYKNYGALHYGPDAPLVTDNSIYDVASLTKVMVTLPLVLKLLEANQLSLEDPLQVYYDRFRGSKKDKVRLHHILSHSAGFKPYYLLGEPELTYEKSKEKMLNYFLSHDLDYEPSQTVRYSGMGLSIIGDLIERKFQGKLDALAQEYIFKPLVMQRTSYGPIVQDDLAQVAPTEVDQIHNRGLIKGQVHDANAYFLHGVAATAGVFSTAKDVAKFAAVMLNEGQLQNGEAFVSAALHNLAIKQQHPYKKNRRGLGWQLGLYKFKHSYGHTGYTGAVLLIDPKTELIVVYLTNRVHPTSHTPEFYKHRRGLFKLIHTRLYRPKWLWTSLDAVNHFFNN